MKTKIENSDLTISKNIFKNSVGKRPFGCCECGHQTYLMQMRKSILLHTAKKKAEIVFFGNIHLKAILTWD